jgi:murein L,D-transpeptidase YcbB/YkuD
MLFLAVILLYTIRPVSPESNYRRPEPSLNSSDLVAEFYKINRQQLFWFNRPLSGKLRETFLKLLESIDSSGLRPGDYHSAALLKLSGNESNIQDTAALRQIDIFYTDAAVSLVRDLYMGRNIPSWISSDEISITRIEQDRKFILESLLKANSDSTLKRFICSLQPVDPEYQFLKKNLAEKILSGDSLHQRKIAIAMNFCRWIHHFQFPTFAIVNIPSATLKFYDADSLLFSMRVVVGKPSTKTPLMATWCDKIILYPYWTIPRKIVLNEYLPMLKKNPAVADSMNIQILDKQGKLVQYKNLDWKNFDKNNFPYELRQSTGCDNALGVVKFNLTSPYDVYMHDSNFKRAFGFEHRFYSHGCIRLEKPILLANAILDHPVDSNFLLACYHNQKPAPVFLQRRLAVFVVYMPAEASDSENIWYFGDVYGLLGRVPL